MGQKQGRLIVVTLMLTKQLVCKSGENCSDSNQSKPSGWEESQVVNGCGEACRLKAKALETGSIYLESRMTNFSSLFERYCV